MASSKDFEDMGKLSGGCKDQGCLDSGLLPTPLDLVAWLVQEWHCLFPVPAMVQETCQRYKYCSRIGSVYPNGISTGPKSISASDRRFKDESGLRQYSVQQRAEGILATYRLRALEAVGREIGGTMLAITGATKLYYVAGFTDMRYGKYALANVVRHQLHRNPYNGDGYMFMSKDRQKMKILVYSHNLYRLYDLSVLPGIV